MSKKKRPSFSTLHRADLAAIVAYCKDGQPGHDIAALDELVKATKVAAEYFEHIEKEHTSSRTDPKFMITGPNGVLSSLKGVYILQLLEAIAADLGIGGCMYEGRGKRAWHFIDAIELKLGGHEPTKRR
jgi:hypothetical protein